MINWNSAVLAQIGEDLGASSPRWTCRLPRSHSRVRLCDAWEHPPLLLL